MHHIQHYILTVLSVTKWARFSDMRPPKVDSNAYSYHLKLLQRQKLIEKHADKGYRLSPLGLAMVDRMSNTELQLRVQPKIITMCVLQDENERVLLLAKSKQPFFGAWTFASGKLHLEDGGARAAMIRELKERVAVAPNPTLTHAADVYISAAINGQFVSTVLAHVFTLKIKANEVTRSDVLWTNDQDRRALQLAPGVKEVCELVDQHRGAFVFSEYHIDW
ncbi:MAG TPA: NUDIX domain-containing protein [Candidatus Saccharimonadales bacterium]